MMRALILRSWISATVLYFACALTCAAQTVHYLDCSTGSDAADSLTPQTAWRTVAKANSYTFEPGDSLLLKRGTRCEGMLWPKGSGTARASIHLGAYGQGALPVIAGGKEMAGVQLYNQQYWEMENLEVVGGSPYGIHIRGTVPVMRHFRITNVVVHDVPGEPLTKDSGLIVVAPDEKAKTIIDDLIVDGVTAYGTSQWAGIIVNGAGFNSGDIHSHGEDIEIRNSIVHDVAGDGILLALATHGVLEHNVAWNTGMQETETIGTPDGIWEWRCSDCLVQYNEGFFTDSPGVDGGVFDIDFGNENNRVAYNFGHDSQGYCVSVFGAEGTSGNSIQSVVEHNTCIHNGRSPRLARRQGAIFLDTWKGGKLNGVTIKDNTVIWEPPLDAAALHATAEFTGELPNLFQDNTILAASGSFVSSVPAVQFSGNRYCAPARTDARLSASTHVESDVAANTPEELCGCMRELLTKTAGAERVDAEMPTAHWLLVAELAPEDESASRSELVLMESMMHQFANRGLRSVVLPTHAMSEEQTRQWQADWNFSPSIHIESGKAEQLRRTYKTSSGQLLLVSPSGTVAARWPYPVAPADVWLPIQSHLGTPAGMQPMPACTNSHARQATTEEPRAK